MYKLLLLSAGSTWKAMHFYQALIYFKMVVSISLLLFSISFSFAQPTLVKDINNIQKSALSEHKNLVNLNGTVFFTALTTATGNELWKSNGTTAGTVLIKDITPGSASSTIANLTVVNNLVFFTANTDSENTQSLELWKTDGTLAGTNIVKDIKAGVSGANPTKLVNVNGTLFFTADDGVNGRELWKSDGTTAGTILVKNIAAGTSSANPGNLIAANGTLLFTIDGQLWKSDGTAAGTTLIKEVGGSPARLTYANGILFFTAYEDINWIVDYEDDYGNLYYTIEGSFQLWKSDGTQAGTQFIKTIPVGPGLPQISNGDPFTIYPISLKIINNTLFFTGGNYMIGYTLYKSDGTANGTIPIKDFYDSYYPYINYEINYDTASGEESPFFTALGNTLYFKVYDQLMKSDGTIQGTVKVKDIDAQINKIINVNNILYLTATNNSSNKGQLWTSDGTDIGTTLVKDTDVSGYPRSMMNANNSLFFIQESYGNEGSQLWTSDGSAQGTIAVNSADTETNNASPFVLGNIHNTLFFTADDGIHGRELWKSNGTDGSTALVKDIYPGIQSSNIFNYAVVNNVLFFVANDSIHGYELWKSDGTSAGTVLVKDIYPGTNSETIDDLTNVNGLLFFNLGSDGKGLWKSDGTEAGTVSITYDIEPGSCCAWSKDFINVNNTLFFATDNNNGSGLWKSNGTSAGTIKLRDFTSVGEGYRDGIINLTDVNGVLFFTAAKKTYENQSWKEGIELWKSNGTIAGTVKVKSFSGSTASLQNVNGTLFFVTRTATQDGWELWKSNGTEAGTILIKTIKPTTDIPMHLTNVNGVLYFTAADDAYVQNRELWKSDGTMAGTIKISAVFPGQYINGPLPIDILINVNEVLYFKGNDGKSGMELWKSNGTKEGTVQVSDIFSGTGSGYPTENHYQYSPVNPLAKIVNVNSTLYFAANNGKAGIELWKFDTEHCTPISKLNVVVQGNNTCSGSNGAITIKASETGVSYQAYLNTAPIGNAVQGNGADISLTIPAVSLSVGNNVYSIQASGCTVASLISTATIIVSSNCQPVTCSASGSILREVWKNVTGTAVSAIPVNTTPTSSNQLTSFEAPSNVDNSYGQRLRGYICAPISGNYTFYISADNNAELWLSTDDDPAKKVRIAHISGDLAWTPARIWNKYSTQKSVVIALVAGKKYYVEALHKENGNGDNLAVAWILPNTTAITLIPGSSLSPYVPSGSGKIARELWNNVAGAVISAIPLNTTPTSTSELSSFEAPSNIANSYGQRLRGYLHPQLSGNYTFYISGDNNAEVWLSTDENPAKKVKIAHISGELAWTPVRIWNKYSTQKSVSIALVAGRKYYVEALHKENSNGDNLAVAWTLPSTTTITVIAGSYLSPFSTTNSVARVGQGEILAETAQVSVYPNPFESKLTLQTSQAGKLQVNITDNLGRSVYQATHLAQTRELEIDLSKANLKAGLYFVSIQTQDGQTKVVRVVKK